jgi:hypothetical protein
MTMAHLWKDGGPCVPFSMYRRQNVRKVRFYFHFDPHTIVECKRLIVCLFGRPSLLLLPLFTRASSSSPSLHTHTTGAFPKTDSVSPYLDGLVPLMGYLTFLLPLFVLGMLLLFVLRPILLALHQNPKNKKRKKND